MIIDPTEVHRFEAACRGFAAHSVVNGVDAGTIWKLLPSMLPACGFAEVLNLSKFPKPNDIRGYSVWDEAEEGNIFMYRRDEGPWLIPWSPPHDWNEPWLGMPFEDFHRIQLARRMERTEHGILLDGKDFNPSWIPMASSVVEIIDSAWAAVRVPPEPQTLLISPRLWCPGKQRQELDGLSETAASIMHAARSQALELADLNWRQLEEIVAYILAKRGMKIHMMKESPQGGRDIIARGELIPGIEPLTIAVEVKHRKVVNRPEVQMALWQNRQFPALLFVTSGRFSTGVIDERNEGENRMRLHLWDGIMLTNLIKAL